MIEIYLFVNPLDEHCLQSEQRFLDIVKEEKQKNRKICLRFVPILNPSIIQHYLVDHDLPVNNLSFRNQLVETLYSACLDIKAAQLQGKKVGRKFLFHLQEMVGRQKRHYSKELVEEILEEIRADKSLFNSDRQSHLVKEFFQQDQKIANEMGVNRFTKAVIFNYGLDQDFGVLIDGLASIDDIKSLIQPNYSLQHLSHAELFK